MAHGENAAKHYGREYWSRRAPRMHNWGRIGKWLTHRYERAAARREEQRILRERQWAEASCPKCGGAGWLWWHELDEYYGPANDPHDCNTDDTRYSCDHECHKDSF